MHSLYIRIRGNVGELDVVGDVEAELFLEEVEGPTGVFGLVYLENLDYLCHIASANIASFRVDCTMSHLHCLLYPLILVLSSFLVFKVRGRVAIHKDIWCA